MGQLTPVIQVTQEARDWGNHSSRLAGQKVNEIWSQQTGQGAVSLSSQLSGKQVGGLWSEAGPRLNMRKPIQKGTKTKQNKMAGAWLKW
jgi:hypothetical protein